MEVAKILLLVLFFLSDVSGPSSTYCPDPPNGVMCGGSLGLVFSVCVKPLALA
jgi:hypothetical protein